MAQQEPPKIEFPCPDYLIKVVGDNRDDFKGYVIETVRCFDPEMDQARIEERASGKGNYISYTLRITAQSEQQLSDLNVALRQDVRVKMVL